MVLIGIYLSARIITDARNFMLPLAFAGLLAILFNPVVEYLVRKKWNRALAILSLLTAATLITSTGVILLSSQVDRFGAAIPVMRQKLHDLSGGLVVWVSDHYHVEEQQISEVLDRTSTTVFESGPAAIGSTLMSLGGVLAMVFLTPVYLFMMLFYQRHLVDFVYKVFGDTNAIRIHEIMTETKVMIQSYLGGLFFEFLIVAALNVTGLLILGIDYAVLLGICGALLNVIPYVGALISVVVFMFVALMTQPPIYILYVLVMYLIIQFIDNNYVVPRIVGSRVKLNALVSLIVVVAGAALWGIPGMFLSIPVLAVVKLILDKVEGMQAWGFLLGHVVIPVKTKLPHERLTGFIRTALKPSEKR